MMTSSNGNIFFALLAICVGNSPVNSPHKGQWRGALIFSLICVWINGWVNNREAGDLRCYRVHYDVSVMHSKIYSTYISYIFIPCLYNNSSYPFNNDLRWSGSMQSHTRSNSWRLIQTSAHLSLIENYYVYFCRMTIVLGPGLICFVSSDITDF